MICLTDIIDKLNLEKYTYMDYQDYFPYSDHDYIFINDHVYDMNCTAISRIDNSTMRLASL